MKGIILAGGKGTRLFPLTQVVSKQLLPIYNKPLIYYPLSLLMYANIREVLFITNPEDTDLFQRFLMDGKQWGMDFSYAIQEEPRGLADAFIVGKDFIKDDSVSLVLGDNIFFGNNLTELVQQASTIKKGANIFGYQVKDPERYGVVEFDDQFHVIGIEEKPLTPKSNYAIPGIYFYDNSVVEKAMALRPSSRNELEITDLNKLYLAEGNLTLYPMSRGIAWLDAGTFESLLQAGNYVQTIEERQGLLVSSPEETALRKNFISHEQFRKLVFDLPNNSYRHSLEQIIRQEHAS